MQRARHELGLCARFDARGEGCGPAQGRHLPRCDRAARSTTAVAAASPAGRARRAGPDEGGNVRRARAEREEVAQLAYAAGADRAAARRGARRGGGAADERAPGEEG
eukprot:1979286-Prymnesium_polylepis.1